MSDNRLRGDAHHINSGPVISASTEPYPVTASATTNTKGAWIEILEDQNYPVKFLFLTISNSASDFSEGSFLIDIGVGTSGNQRVIFPNFLFTKITNFVGGRNGVYLAFPIEVPPGESVWARCQCTSSSEVVLISASGVTYGSFEKPVFQHFDVFGVNVSTSRGTLVDNDTTANAKGPWESLGTLSSTSMYYGFILAWTLGLNSGPRNQTCFIDFGVTFPGEGSVMPILENVFFNQAGNQALFPCVTPFIDFSFVPGSELHARVQTSQLALDDGTFDVAIYLAA